MKISLDLNREKLEKNMKIAVAVAGGMIGVIMLKGINDIVREFKQNRNIKRLKKQVKDLEERVEALEEK